MATLIPLYTTVNRTFSYILEVCLNPSFGESALISEALSIGTRLYASRLINKSANIIVVIVLGA